MLLKNGHRHVYLSRKFAVKHGFVPKDASLGYYGYGGLVKYVSVLLNRLALTLSTRYVSIGSWPVRLYVLNDQGERELSLVSSSHTVYLSEEHHFDVVLGRSFMEKRQVWCDDLPSIYEY